MLHLYPLTKSVKYYNKIQYLEYMHDELKDKINREKNNKRQKSIQLLRKKLKKTKEHIYEIDKYNKRVRRMRNDIRRYTIKILDYELIVHNFFNKKNNNKNAFIEFENENKNISNKYFKRKIEEINNKNLEYQENQLKNRTSLIFQFKKIKI